MKIDNLNRIAALEKANYITAITLIIGSALLALLVDEKFLGLNKWFWVIFLASLFIVPKIILFLMRINYINYNDEEGDKIILRYIPQGSFKTQRKSIEIKKNELIKYSVINSKAGLNKHLILFQKTPKGVAKYQPVSIKGLTKNEISNLLNSLGNYSKK